jgi:hypothetical protein
MEILILTTDAIINAKLSLDISVAEGTLIRLINVQKSVVMVSESGNIYVTTAIYYLMMGTKLHSLIYL